MNNSRVTASDSQGSSKHPREVPLTWSTLSEIAAKLSGVGDRADATKKKNLIPSTVREVSLHIIRKQRRFAQKKTYPKKHVPSHDYQAKPAPGGGRSYDRSPHKKRRQPKTNTKIELDTKQGTEHEYGAVFRATKGVENKKQKDDPCHFHLHRHRVEPSLGLRNLGCIKAEATFPFVIFLGWQPDHMPSEYLKARGDDSAVPGDAGGRGGHGRPSDKEESRHVLPSWVDPDSPIDNGRNLNQSGPGSPGYKSSVTLHC